MSKKLKGFTKVLVLASNYALGAPHASSFALFNGINADKAQKTFNVAHDARHQTKVPTAPYTNKKETLRHRHN